MTEQTMNQAIEKLAENYNQLEQSLVNQLRLQVPNHQLTVGTYRERVWKSLFEMIIPKSIVLSRVFSSLTPMGISPERWTWRCMMKCIRLISLIMGKSSLFPLRR